MIETNINNSNERPRILVAPLDWGLGHATRCIPIIKSLISNNAEVLVAGEEAVAQLVKKEFPHITVLTLKGYRVYYPKRKSRFTLNLLLQLPKIFLAIRNEKKWLDKIILSEKINAVISDNRAGLYSSSIPCIYITHQLQIMTGHPISDKFIQQLHYKYINRFSECWVPDNKDEPFLGGSLSHPVLFPSIPTRYIGFLSRLKHSTGAKKYDFLLLISGPEPQRSVFEKILLEIFLSSTFRFIMVRGLPHLEQSLPGNQRCTIINHLPTGELNDLFPQCETVIARSGYTTIMDLVATQQKAILVPTPGQSEQEYLAGYLDDKKIFPAISQERLSLKTIAAIHNSPAGSPAEIESSWDDPFIADWLDSIRRVVK